MTHMGHLQVARGRLGRMTRSLTWLHRVGALVRGSGCDRNGRGDLSVANLDAVIATRNAVTANPAPAQETSVSSNRGSGPFFLRPVASMKKGCSSAKPKQPMIAISPSPHTPKADETLSRRLEPVGNR